MNILNAFFNPHCWKENRHLKDIPKTREVYWNTLDMAVPAVAEAILISLISSVDMIMVGSLGKFALSAVGLTNQPKMVIICFFTALNIGVAALLARRKGENNQSNANKTLCTSIVTTIGLALLLMAAALIFTLPLMKLAGGSYDTEENTIVLNEAITYFRVIMYALPMNAISMTICAAQRGVGRTKVTFYVNVLSNAVNVFFNYLLIEGHLGFPALGVLGAAIASDIGIFFGMVFALMVVTGKWNRKNFLYLKLRDLIKFDRNAFKSLVNIGSNAVVEQLGMRIGFFICGRIYFMFGTTTFSAHQICMQVLNLTFSFGDGLAVAATTLVGRSLGQKKPELAMIYGKICQRCAVIAAMCLFVILISCRTMIASFYINRNTLDADQVIEIAARTMIVLAFAQPFQINAFTIAGGLRGAGDNLFVAIAVAICVTFIRPIMAFMAVYVFHLDLFGTWIMAQSEMVLRCALFYPRLTHGKWKDIKI